MRDGFCRVADHDPDVALGCDVGQRANISFYGMTEDERVPGRGLLTDALNGLVSASRSVDDIRPSHPGCLFDEQRFLIFFMCNEHSYAI